VLLHLFSEYQLPLDSWATELIPRLGYGLFYASLCTD